MGLDEDRAFEILHKNREIYSELIEQHDGSLIKEMECDMPASFALAQEEICEHVDIPFANGE